MTSVAEVRLWGSLIGAVAYDDGANAARFQYSPEFLGSGIEVSPLMMPLGSAVYEFPALSRRSFHGLPGLLADSLPDDFGNSVLNAWIASQELPPQMLEKLEKFPGKGPGDMPARDRARERRRARGRTRLTVTKFRK